jgi:hypothetical protein
MKYITIAQNKIIRLQVFNERFSTKVKRLACGFIHGSAIWNGRQAGGQEAG